MTLSKEELKAVRETRDSPGWAIIMREIEPKLRSKDAEAFGQSNEFLSSKMYSATSGWRACIEAQLAVGEYAPLPAPPPDDYPTAPVFEDTQERTKR